SRGRALTRDGRRPVQSGRSGQSVRQDAVELARPGLRQGDQRSGAPTVDLRGGSKVFRKGAGAHLVRLHLIDRAYWRVRVSCSVVPAKLSRAVPFMVRPSGASVALIANRMPL